MKKLLLLFAAICCMMVAKAQQFEDANGIKYNVTSTENNTVEVIANGYSGDIVIPATVTNENVTYNVTRIGDHAFYYCDNVTSVTLPESLKSIGSHAFSLCGNLTSISLPHSVTEIGELAFYYCVNLTSVVLPYSLESIADEAFEHCYELASITFPEGLKSIGRNAFWSCEKLASINIPSSVTSIGNYAFAYCESLSSISVDEGNTVYKCPNSCNAIIEKATNTLVVGCKNTVIPSSVTAIGISAFYGCYNLTSITIPSTVTIIGKDAFYDCNKLASVTIPGSVTEVGASAFSDCEDLASVTLQNGITSIGNSAFSNCDKLTSITIPGSVTSMGEHAFSYCNGLVSVTLQNGVTSIGEYAFYDCDKLASVTIPGSVTEVGRAAFLYCVGLKTITLSISVESIGDYAFSNCTALESITVLASAPPTLNGDDVFNYVDKSIPVYVPDVTAYSGWGGFTNFIAIDIEQYKQAAIDEINAAKEDVSLSAEEETAISGYITTINGVTTLSDANLAIIENAKNAALAVINLRIAKDNAIAEINAAMQEITLSDDETTAVNGYIQQIQDATTAEAIITAKNAALAIISQAIIRPVREAALAAIESAMQGETSAYLTALVQPYINTINTATDVTDINNAKETALALLNVAMGPYQAGKAEALGEMGTECEDCPAVEVKKGTTTINLYNPESVTFKKTE